MSRSEEERFADILDAIQRCKEYALHLRSDELAPMPQSGRSYRCAKRLDCSTE